MKEYHDLTKRVLLQGDFQFNQRTGLGTIAQFGDMSRYDLREGFPVMTTKKVGIFTSAKEMFWFMRGERNFESLLQQGVHFWDGNAFDLYLKRQGIHHKVKKHTSQWGEEYATYLARVKDWPGFAREEGDLGPVYGFQWRHWPKFVKDETGNWVRGEVDQLKGAIEKLKRDPSSRQNIVTAWNPADIPDMALPPCHALFQFNSVDGNLDVLMFQRSCDLFLGVPFNITGYSLLTHLVAKEAGLKPRYFVHQYGNVHAYTGIAPRSEFLADKVVLNEFRELFEVAANSINPNIFLDVRDWYNEHAPAEGEGHEGKDHVPALLTQLSRVPKGRPKLEITSDASFDETIQRSPKDVLKLDGYYPYPAIPAVMAV
jgi:thymidylate synthase